MKPALRKSCWAEIIKCALRPGGIGERLACCAGWVKKQQGAHAKWLDPINFG